jgi:hypothetical protein
VRGNPRSRHPLLLALLLGAALAASCDVPPRIDCDGPRCICEAQQTCSFDSCDENCELTCERNSDCVTDIGRASVVTCVGATCAITVGDDSTVECQTDAICNVACTGTCTVDCREAAGCYLSCGGETPAALDEAEGECP